MLSLQTASSIAGNFLAHYYNEFVEVGEMTAMSDLYNDNSYVIMADLSDEKPSVVHGKHLITLHLATLDRTLGKRKVEVITADSMPLPNGGVQIICQGVMYLARFRRVFLHVMTLEPTAFRMNTYHLSADYLRFVNIEEEVIPEGALVLAPDEVATFLEEENKRREKDRQHRQILELQQRLRQQEHRVEEQREVTTMVTPASRQQRAPPRAVREPQGSRQPTDRPPRGGPANPENNHNPSGERPPRRERQNAAPAPTPGAAAASERPVRPERQPREERHHTRNADDNPNTAQPAAVAGVAASRKRERRVRKPQGGAQVEETPVPVVKEAAATTTAPTGPERRPRNAKEEGAARFQSTVSAGSTEPPAADSKQGPGRSKMQRRGPTTFVRLHNVPKTVKLSDISATVAQSVERPLDAYWFGRDSIHAVLKFSSEAAAASLYTLKKYTVEGNEVAVFAFYP